MFIFMSNHHVLSFRKIGRNSSDRNIEGSGKIRFHDQKKGMFFNDQHNFENYNKR